MKFVANITLGLSLVIAVPVAAQDKSEQTPARVVTQVVDCRAISESAQRLACFDTTVAALAQAQAAKELVVVSKEDVREARRGLFGFTLPKLRLFGGEDDQDNDVKEISATVASASQSRTGGWVFNLTDNGTWQQTDDGFIGTPSPGDTVVIRRAAFGSYFAKLNDRPGFRIKRLR